MSVYARVCLCTQGTEEEKMSILQRPKVVDYSGRFGRGNKLQRPMLEDLHNLKARWGKETDPGLFTTGFVFDVRGFHFHSRTSEGSSSQAGLDEEGGS